MNILNIDLNKIKDLEVKNKPKGNTIFKIANKWNFDTLLDYGFEKHKGTPYDLDLIYYKARDENVEYFVNSSTRKLNLSVYDMDTELEYSLELFYKLIKNGIIEMCEEG